MLKQKIMFRMHTIKKVRWTLNTKDAMTLYKSFVLPDYDHGDIFYYSTNKDSLKCLQT